MKNIIILISCFVAFIYLICEPEILNVKVVLLKIISLIYLFLVAKANNYFYWGEL